MFLRLSYDLDSNAPGWPGNPKLEAHRTTSIDNGDLVNHTLFTLFTHFGSHLDTALHWTQHGKAVTDLPIDAFIYEKPVVIDIPKGAEEMISADEIRAHLPALVGCDCLLIRTGFSRFRTNDPQLYSAQGPALSPEAARFVLDAIPTLRAIGADFISIASPAHIEEAIETHRILLGYYDSSRWVVILEDFRLDLDLTGLKRLFALPLFLQGAEGSPCTIVAEVER
jgi:arylformamidase